MTTKVSARELIESGAHYGHQTRRWNPKMEEYLHGSQEGVHVFDLIQTKALFEEALEAIESASRAGKQILIIGTKKQAKAKVKEIGARTGVHTITERWLGGIITNFAQIKKSIKKLDDMRTKLANGDYKRHTKKERLLITREIERLERFFGGISTLSAPPELLIIIDIKREFGAVKEASGKSIETVGIVDSNCDPTLVTYPVPMNDDATRAIEYALELIEAAIVAGKKPSVKAKKVSEKSEKKTVKKAKSTDKSKTKKSAKKIVKKAKNIKAKK